MVASNQKETKQQTNCKHRYLYTGDARTFRVRLRCIKCDRIIECEYDRHCFQYLEWAANTNNEKKSKWVKKYVHSNIDKALGDVLSVFGTV